MNILVVCHYGLYQNLTASFVHNQVKAYVSLGHSVRVIIPFPIGKRLSPSETEGGAFLKHRTADGAKLFYVRFLSLSNLGQPHFNTPSAITAIRLRLPVILDGFAPDVIHAHTLGLDSEVGGWLKKRMHIPLVVTTHGSDTSIPVEQGKGNSLKPLCDQADAVATVSTALADKLRTCATTTPIVTILNGFNVQALPEKQAKADLSFIQASNLQEQKRPHVTLHAFAMLRQAHPDATLCFVGQGPERDRLESMSRKLGLSGGVRFTGQLPNSDVLVEMSKAQFFILPSVREGFGIVYLEAMSCGCVTIGTEGEGIADLIVSGKNGFLTPPDNPEAIVRTVEWCLSHPEETATITERGRQDASALTWGKNAEEYIKLFKELRDGN